MGIVCVYPSKQVEDLAKELGLPLEEATTLMGAYMTATNTPDVLPPLSALQAYKEQNEKDREKWKEAIPNYEVLPFRPKAVEKEGPIDIWYSDRENGNGQFSNMARRPFKYGAKQTTFDNVEQAFQAAKFQTIMQFMDAMISNETVSQEVKSEAAFIKRQAFDIIQKIKNEKDPYEVKKLGKTILKPKSLDGTRMIELALNNWDNLYRDKFMKAFITESFKQNPAKLQELIATSQPFTHERDKGYWKEAFPRILTEVREELKKAYMAPLPGQAKVINGKFFVQLLDPKMSMEDTLNTVIRDLINQGIPLDDAAQTKFKEIIDSPRAIYAYALHMAKIDYQTAYGTPAAKKHKLALERVEKMKKYAAEAALYRVSSTVSRFGDSSVHLPGSYVRGMEIRETKYSKMASAFTAQQLEARKEMIAREFSANVSERLQKAITAVEDEIASIENEEDPRLVDLKSRLDVLKDPVKGRQKVIEGSKEGQTELGNIYNELLEFYKETQQEYAEEGDLETAQKYQDIVDNFETLFEQATVIIEGNENLRIMMEDVQFDNGKGELSNNKKLSTKESIKEELKKEEEIGDDPEGKRATGNEGWAFKVRFMDPFTSLSAQAKAIFADIKKTNVDGTIVEDDLGYTQYYSPAYVHAVLLYEMSRMTNARDFNIKKEDGTYEYPALKKAAMKYPWIQQIIDKLQADPNAGSILFNDLRKDRTDFWKQKVGEKQRTVNGKKETYWGTKAFSINNTVVADSVLEEVAENISNGDMLSTNSVYDSMGELVRENVLKQQQEAQTLQMDIQEIENEEDIHDIAVRVADLLGSIGMQMPVTYAENLMLEGLYDEVRDILTKASAVLNGIGMLEDSTNLVGVLTKQYSLLAEVAGVINEVVPSLSTREGEKNLPSYAAPNYIDTLIKELSSEETWRQATEELKQFGFFYDAANKKWLNSWLEYLTMEGDEGRYHRQQLSIMALDNINGVEYADWEQGDIKLAGVRQYLITGRGTNNNTNYTWYQNPIYSDSTTMNFVKFVRYTGDFKAQLLPKFAQVVKQELFRMRQVQERKRVREESGGAVAMEIQNFDKNGMDFHFFPALNKYRGKEGTAYYEWLQSRLFKGEGKVDGAFRDYLVSLVEQGKLNEYEAAIQEAVEDVINQDFQEWRYMKDTNTAQTLDENGASTNISIEDVVAEACDLDISDKNEQRAANLEEVERLLEEYFWNQEYATSQIIQLAVTDPAFFKADNGVDFQKRFKQVYAAGVKLNTEAQYGTSHELTIYLADEFNTSLSYTSLIKNLEQAVEAKRMTEEQKMDILDAMTGINATDAQAYRNIYSMRKLLSMMGKWTEQMQQTFDRFEKNTWTQEDFNTVWQTIKPFVYTQIAKSDGVGGRIRVPHQNKNSEFLLLAMFNLLNQSQDSSPQLRALDRAMKNYNIDVAQFSTAVKAGGQGIIDITTSPTKVAEALKNMEFAVDEKVYHLTEEAKDWKGIKKELDTLLKDGTIKQEEYNAAINYFRPTEKEVYDTIVAAITKNANNTDVASLQDQIKKTGQATTLENGRLKGLNEEVVHMIPYKDFVVQQPTPEHLFDATAVFGSQFRNLITADMIEEMNLQLANGQTLKTGKEVKELFQSLIVENLLEDYQKVAGRFATIETLQEAIRETIKGNPKYGREFYEALEIVEIGDTSNRKKVFNLPMHTPTITVKLQEIVNAMFKSAIAKQSIKGGNAILVSNFGYTKDLKVVRDEETGRLIEVQCKLPWYSAKYFEPFLKQKEGKEQWQLDINEVKKMDPSLLELIGYRIPTEGKYSMLPLTIVGFLPQQNGSAIMLPADITTIAGSDFDVDKLFMMMPEFRVTSHNKARARKDYNELAEKMQDSPAGMETLGDFDSWFKKNKDTYKLSKPIIKKIRYPHLDPAKLSREQRNNLLLDISRAILTHPVMSEHFNSYGTFDTVKLAARKANILTNMPTELIQKAKAQGMTPSQYLDSLSLKKLNEFIKATEKPRSMLSPGTFMYFHRQNMTGGKLIGMYANNTVMQAKLQGKDLRLLPQYEFEINGRRMISLTQAYTDVNGFKMRISKNCAELAAASVDNAKDPVLADLMQNTDTANILGAMVRLGMTIEEAGAFFSHPEIRNNPTGRGFHKMLLDTPNLLTVQVAINEMQGWRNRGTVNTKDLIDAIAYINEAGGIENFLEGWGLLHDTHREMVERTRSVTGNAVIKGTEDYMKEGLARVQERNPKVIEYLRNYLEAMDLYEDIARIGEDVGNLTNVSRADSPNGAIQHTFAKAIKQQANVRKLLQAATKTRKAHEKSQREGKAITDPVSSILGMENVLPLNNYLTLGYTKERMRDMLLKSDMPMLQAFYSLGIDLGIQNISQYFAPYQAAGKHAIDVFIQNTPYKSVKDKVLEDFLFGMTTYMLGKTKFFGDEEGGLTYEQKRDYYLKEFPAIFEAMKLADPTLKQNKAIRALTFNKKKGALVMEKSTGKRQTVRETLMGQFEQLIYQNPQLAKDLLRYSFYKDGLNFGPGSYGNYFSPTFLSQFPEVVHALRTMDAGTMASAGISDTRGEVSSYYTQFLLQNYERMGLLSLVDKKEGGMSEVMEMMNQKSAPRTDITLASHRVEDKYTGLDAPYIVYNGSLYKLKTVKGLVDGKMKTAYTLMAPFQLSSPVYNAKYAGKEAALFSKIYAEEAAEFAKSKEEWSMEDWFDAAMEDRDNQAPMFDDEFAEDSAIDPKQATPEIKDTVELSTEPRVVPKVEQKYNPEEGLRENNEEKC